MKTIKRIVSIVLAISLISVTLTACSFNENKSENGNNASIKKGEFFEMFIGETGLYPISCTIENLENDTHYKYICQTIVDWKLMSADSAKKNLNKPVTRETVATVCVNNMYFRTKGSLDDIKDIDKFDDKQAIADAVASGLFEAKDGYFMGKRTMSYDECMSVIEKSEQIDADGKYDEDEGTFDFDKTDLKEISSDDLHAGDIELVSSDNVQKTSYDQNGVSIVNLGYNNNPIMPSECVSYNAVNTYAIPMDDWIGLNKKQKYSVGDRILYVSNPEPTFTQHDFLNRDSKDIFKQEQFGPVVIAGKIEKINTSDRSKVYITVSSMTAEEANDRTDVKCFTRKISLDSKFFSSLINDNEEAIKKATGCSIKVDSAPGDGVKITASKELSFSSSKYTNPKSQWRNSKITPTFSASLSIGNMSVTVNDWKDFMKNKKHDAVFKLNYDTAAEFKAETGGLRFAPDTNGNSGWKNAISRSRLTSDSSQGAKEIKLTKKPITVVTFYGVLSLKIDIKLEVHLDGTITIKVEQANTIGIDNKSGHIRGIKEKDIKSRSVEVKVNLEAYFNIRPYIDLIGFNFLDMCVSPGIRLTAVARIFQQKEESSADKKSLKYEKLEEGVYAGEKELKQVAEKDKSIHFCFDFSMHWKIKLQFITDKCEIGKVARKLGILGADSLSYDSDWKDFPDAIRINKIHFDDGKKVDKCTFSDDEKEITVGNSISLSTYEVDMNKNSVETIKVLELPLSKGKLQKEYRGVRVKIDNENVAKASISNDYTQVFVTAVGPGVTTGVVYINKTVGDGKFDYKHKFTVVVSDNEGEKTILASFDNSDEISDFQFDFDFPSAFELLPAC